MELEAEKILKDKGICKTMIVEDKEANHYAFFLKARQRIDFSKAKQAIGKKVKIVTYEGVKKATGKEPGAICPFLIDMPIFVDSHVFESEKINFGSGDHLYGLEIHSKDLEKVIKFETVNVSSER